MKKKLAIPFLLVFLLAIILIISFYFLEKRRSITTTQTPGTHIPNKHNQRGYIETDLYYYKHPYLAKADFFNDQRQYDSAVYYYKVAADRFAKEHLWESYIWVNGYIARLYLFVSKIKREDPLPYLKIALEKGYQHLKEDHPFIGVAYYYTGIYYSYSQHADSALKMFEKALKTYDQYYREPNIYTSDVYEQIGNVYYNLKFDNVNAARNYHYSVTIKETLPSILKDSVLTISYYNLVRLYYSIGDVDKTQTYCYKALQYVSYVKGSRLKWLRILEGVLAKVYSEHEMYTVAIPRLKNLVSVNDKDMEGKVYLSFYYNALGGIYKMKQQYDTAIVYFRKALDATTGKSTSQDNDFQNSVATYSLGVCFLQLHQLTNALNYLKKSLKKRIKLYGNSNDETALALNGIGNVYREANNTHFASHYYQSAISACSKSPQNFKIQKVPLYKDINNSLSLVEIIKDKATLLKQLYFQKCDIRQLDTALAYYLLADTLISNYKFWYSREVTKLSFAKNNTSLYEEAIDCGILLSKSTGERRYQDVVFQFMDKRKAGLLMQGLDQKAIVLTTGNSIERLMRLQQELTFLQSRLEELSDNDDDSLRKVLHHRIDTTEAAYQGLEEQISKRSLLHDSININKNAASLKELQQFTSSNNAIIVEYFWGNKAVYVLGAFKHNVVVFKIEESKVKWGVDTLRMCLEKNYVIPTKEKDFRSFQKHSFNTYNDLLKPVLDTFRKATEMVQPGLIIIPDGPISYIPFEALDTEARILNEVDYRKVNYLIKNFDVSYDYSAQMLLRNYSKKENVSNSRVLAMSYSRDDVLDEGTRMLKKFKRHVSSELPGSAREVESISSFLNGQYYMGNHATEYVFKKEAPKYGIIHLAVHGQADTAFSYRSRLVFNKGSDSSNDGYLYPYELYSIPLIAKLVVLSACESGKGKFNAGEGVYSLARGFMYAGCPSTITSLWKVNDYATADIMTSFYKHLCEGNRLDLSLRDAKLDYLRSADRRNAHPGNWASFIAMGNMSAVIKRKDLFLWPPLSKVVILLILIGGVVLLFLQLTKRRNGKSPFG